MDKLAYSVSEAVAVSGVGRTKLYQAIADSSLPSLRCGARRLILREDLERWLQSLRVPAGG